LTPRVLCFKLATDTAAASSLDAAWPDSEVAIKSATTTAAAVKLETGNQAHTRKKRRCREKRKETANRGRRECEKR
jgi:hypothetical protein